MLWEFKGKSTMGSFKLPYSRSLPRYLAPKQFNTKTEEEFFITSLYARCLTWNKVKVLGWEVCEDDSNKGADTIIHFEGGSNTIQVTRLTLTNYIGRVKAAEKRADNVITEIEKFVRIPRAINVRVHPLYGNTMPPKKDNSAALDLRLAREIASLIKQNMPALMRSEDFVNCSVWDEKLRGITRHIELQSIPDGCYSSFYGRGNLFVDFNFNNVMFTENDIDVEIQSIFDKKNNGKAEILLIWADKFDILYQPEVFAEKLKRYFSDSSFGQVLFFSFYNMAEMFLHWELENFIIKDDALGAIQAEAEDGLSPNPIASSS